MKIKEYSHVSRDYVSYIPWMADCDFSFIERLPSARRKIYSKDEIIILQGENNKHIFYIEKGRVKYTIYSSSGKEKTIAIIIEGNIFGEISSWDGLPCPCSVIAVSDEVATYRVNIDDFRELCHDPEINRLLISTLIRRSRILISGSLAYNLKNATARVATCLLGLCKKFGVRNKSEYCMIPINFTHQQMADLMGVSRVTITNILNKMRKEQLIDWNSHYLIILDEDGLSALE